MTPQQTNAWNVRILNEIKSEIVDAILYCKTNVSDYSKEQRKLKSFDEIVEILGLKGDETC